jgi:hypothetical protein
MGFNIKLGIFIACAATATTASALAKADPMITPVNQVLGANDHYDFDLTQSGVNQFTIKTHLIVVSCQNGGGYYTTLSATPLQQGAGVLAAYNGYGAAFMPGDTIGGNPQLYSPDVVQLESTAEGSCGNGMDGNYPPVTDAYLPLVAAALDGNGNPTGDVNYGYAHLLVELDPDGIVLQVTVEETAFESALNTPIVASPPLQPLP